MIITALVTLCCTTLLADVPRTAATPPAVEVKSAAPDATTAEAKSAKPDAPTPKVSSVSDEEVEASGGVEPAVPSSSSFLNSPVRPASSESFETPRKRAIWYGLMAADHGAAALDAWTTRRAIEGGYGLEADPLERPFAHSNAIYASTQVSPLVMDYLGRRMMRSSHPWMRRVWWVPQAACASVSFGSGIHNYHVVP